MEIANLRCQPVSQTLQKRNHFLLRGGGPLGVGKKRDKGVVVVHRGEKPRGDSFPIVTRGGGKKGVRG